MSIPKEIRDLLKARGGIRLDIACGENKQDNFVGMDIRRLPGVDIVWDCEEYPWPLPDESVIAAVCSHFVEHINPHRGGFLRFMDEVWRVMKPDCPLAVTTPYGLSLGYLQDPTHVNPCIESTFLYFDPLESSSGGLLYSVYKPKPWRIVDMVWDANGNVDVLLRKRRWDVSYGEMNYRELNAQTVPQRLAR